jgi:tetratricopeptide (TPR) repeat protein
MEGKKMEESKAIYERILAKGPSQETTHIILSKMKEEGLHARVIQECIRALAINSDHIRIRRLLAETYLESGLLSQAETELEGVAVQLDHLSSTYKRLGEVYNRQGRVEEAHKVLNVYLVHQPKDQEALDLRDSLERMKEDRLTEQIPVSEEIVEAVEEDQEALQDLATPKLAEIYFDQGLIHEAVETYEKVLVQNPEDNVSRERLEALKEMLIEEKAEEDRARVKEKKEVMITMLEGWLTNLRNRSKPPVTY